MRNRPSAIERVGAFFVAAADTVLYRQGEAADSVYFLESGAVTISTRSSDGSQSIARVQGPGVFFGARSLGEESFAFTARALLESAVVRVPKAAVRDLLRTDSDFAAFFARQMMRRAAELEEEQVDRVANSTRKRLARLLLILASLGPDGNEDSVLQRVSEHMLAQILTVDPSSIHTLLHEFRRAGYLGEGEALTVRSSLVEVLLPQ